MNYKAYLLKIGVIALLITLSSVIPTVLSIYHSPSPGDGGDTANINANILIEYTPPEPRMGDSIEFVFTVKDKETGNIVVHIDYTVKVLKDGNELYRKAFHDHEGNLKVKFEYREGDIQVEGSASAGGEFTVYGPIFSEPGSYTVSVSVVGIEFSPIDPFSNETVVEVLAAETQPQEPPQEPPQDQPDQGDAEPQPGDDTQPDDGANRGDEMDGVMDGQEPMEGDMDGNMFMGLPLMYLFIAIGIAVVVAAAFLFTRGRT